MRKPYRWVKNCRCCSSDELQPYLDLGEQPLANDYRRDDPGMTPLWSRFPLQVQVCRNCFHSQLSLAVDPQLLYRNYLYVSGTTETFRRHQADLAADLIGRVQQHEAHYPRVLDVACNDGSQLEQFRSRGCLVRGVDPAENLRAITREKGLDVLCDFWSVPLAREMAQHGELFDAITATNVLAHVDDPLGFLLACGEVLADRGQLVVEFPYGKSTLERCEFDQVYHEHLSYFTVKSFFRLAQSAGLVIVDIRETPIHGGSIRFYLRRDSGRWSPTLKLWQYLEHEREAGLYDLDRYTAFQARVDANVLALRDRVEQALDGKGIPYLPVAYGASAKLNTVLNYAELDLAFAVDDNPLKWGHLTPGRAVPIHSRARLQDVDVPLLIILGAWNFREEIRHHLAAGLPPLPDGYRHKLLTYVPEVTVEEL